MNRYLVDIATAHGGVRTDVVDADEVEERGRAWVFLVGSSAVALYPFDGVISIVTNPPSTPDDPPPWEHRLEHLLTAIARNQVEVIADLGLVASSLDSWGRRILMAIEGPPAVSARLILTNPQGDPEPMPSTITVDTVGEKLDLVFVDDKGDTDAAPPTASDGSAAVIAFASSDPAVLTVDDTGAITVVGEGSADLSCTIDDSAGNPILEADGTTPFAPAAVTVSVTAGLAVGARLTVEP